MKAFATNKSDPNYRALSELRYKDGDTEREMKVPKGDVLHQFRNDVNSGQLPTVSWIVGSANFSDHPGAPWYGAWYVSEVIDILTKKPEVWKKTIFILCYDENDGYFDHVPPFVAPNPADKTRGSVSKNIDSSVEYVTLEQDKQRVEEKYARESPIGLGYRVPLVIASPWSRGGVVCSQVFDHTSILQFLEKFCSAKTGKEIRESNISAWRRTVCGDLTSVFKPYNGEKIKTPEVVARDRFYESIHKAQFKKDPSGYKALSNEEIKELNKKPASFASMPRQEQGKRSSCALPYELYADARLSVDKSTIELNLRAGNEVFADKAAGAPFIAYASGENYLSIRNYAVTAGDQLNDIWIVNEFPNRQYQLKIHGPNGFYREAKGNAADPGVQFVLQYVRKKKNKLSGDVELQVTNFDTIPLTIEIVDNAYKKPAFRKNIGIAGSGKNEIHIILDLRKSHGWYDFTVRITGSQMFERRYAGHVETGETSFTDPFMGDVV
jgi:phospholipase C